MGAIPAPFCSLNCDEPEPGTAHKIVFGNNVVNTDEAEPSPPGQLQPRSDQLHVLPKPAEPAPAELLKQRTREDGGALSRLRSAAGRLLTGDAAARPPLPNTGSGSGGVVAVASP